MLFYLLVQALTWWKRLVWRGKLTHQWRECQPSPLSSTICLPTPCTEMYNWHRAPSETFWFHISVQKHTFYCVSFYAFMLSRNYYRTCFLLFGHGVISVLCLDNNSIIYLFIFYLLILVYSLLNVLVTNPIEVFCRTSCIVPKKTNFKKKKLFPSSIMTVCFSPPPFFQVYSPCRFLSRAHHQHHFSPAAGHADGGLCSLAAHWQWLPAKDGSCDWSWVMLLQLYIQWRL